MKLKYLIFIMALVVLYSTGSSYAMIYEPGDMGLTSIALVQDYDGESFLVYGSASELSPKVVLYNPTTDETTDILCNKSIKAMTVQANGNFVFCDSYHYVYVCSFGSDVDGYDLTPVAYLSSANNVFDMISDSNNNIFIASESSGSIYSKIYELTYPSYSLSTYWTGLSSYSVRNIAIHPDGLIIDEVRCSTGTVTQYVKLLSPELTTTTLYSWSSVLAEEIGMSVASNGDVYLGRMTHITHLDYSDSWAADEVTTLSANTDGIVILNDGLVYVEDSNQLFTYATEEAVGGYYYITPPITDYNTNPSIEWASSSYATGDTATINFDVENYDYDAYDYTIEIHDTTSLKQVYELDDVDDNSISYSFSPSAISSTYLAQFIATNTTTEEEDVLAMGIASFTAADDTYSIEFDDSTYRIGDTMMISYTDLPSGSSIYLRGRDDSSTVYSKTWSVSGSSHVSLTVPENDVETYTAYALYDDYILDYDVAEVITSISDVAVYGSVYDAATGAPIQNAHILINGSGPFSNSVGRYSIVIDAGTYDLVVSKDGYNTQRFYDVPFLVDTNRNFYLTASSGSSSGDEASLYGVVRDYETGDALESAMVTVTNSTFTKTTFTSSTGFYDLTGLTNNTAYSVYSNHDGYDNYYNASVTVTGMTWLEFDLVDESYGLGSSDGSSTTEERTSRTAAQESLDNLEATIPSLITFVVFMVFKAVMEK